MSKRFKGKSCVYCLDPHSDDGDHVICRQFFLPQHRGNLPKVPSCRRCNKTKSDLEHYLTTVLPFAGQHRDAGTILTTMVPSRLGKNAKLHSELLAGKTVNFLSKNGGPWAQRVSLPFDSQRLVMLYEYVAKGLVWHHWGMYFTPQHIVRAGFYTNAGQQILETLISMNGNCAQDNIGNGAFVYKGVQSEECPELTIWRMSLYGAELEGDRKARFESVQNCYVVTVPRKMPVAVEFVRLLGLAITP